MIFINLKEIFADNNLETKLLQNGTVGEVKLIKDKDCNYVLKTQRKWERHGDPDCWRREFDLYFNEFDKVVNHHIKLPKCYDLSIDGDTTYILMEYIQGRTGQIELNVDELSYVAKKLGELQSELLNKNANWLRNYPAVESSFDLWYSKIKHQLNEPIQDFPEELRRILNDYVNRSDEILESFKHLPRTICHGDVHYDNIILRENDIYLIDWDSAGYGYVIEDAIDMLMEAFLYSERDVYLIHEYKRRIIESYINGSGYYIDELTINNIIMMAWGFRIAAEYCYYSYYTDENAKQRRIDILQTLCKSI